MPSRSGESPTRRTRRSWRCSQFGRRAGREGRGAREGREERGRRNRATATFLREGRGLAPPPHAPRETSRRTAVASAAGVPPGRACRGPPRACESHRAAGDSSAGMASRAGLRQPSSACGRSRAGLRQPGSALLALASAPSAAASRLPSAAPLGHSATPVCLRRRAQPARSLAPGLSRFPRSARYAPRHSRPSAPRPPLPRRRCRRPRARLARGVVGQDVAASRTMPRHRGGIPADGLPDVRPVPSAGGPRADEGRRPRWRPYPDASPYHLRRYSSRVTSPAATSSMSWRFSAAVSCTIESS